MTETERKALAWINQFAVERGGNPVDSFDFEADVIGAALIRAIKQHEAFKREISDAVEAAKRVYGGHLEAFDQLERFILPKPVDPLVEALKAIGASWPEAIDRFRAALAARGLKIVEDKA